MAQGCSYGSRLLVMPRGTKLKLPGVQPEANHAEQSYSDRDPYAQGVEKPARVGDVTVAKQKTETGKKTRGHGNQQHDQDYFQHTDSQAIS